VSALASEDVNDYAISTKDVAELVELVAKLMEEYNKRISQVYRLIMPYVGNEFLYPFHRRAPFLGNPPMKDDAD
jgi:hypothetical protein